MVRVQACLVPGFIKIFMKKRLVTFIFLNSIVLVANCQVNGSKNYYPLAFSFETQVPVQNLARLSYSFENSQKALNFSLFLQVGIPFYIDQSVDFIIDKDEKANPYLKKNISPLPGIGIGSCLSIHSWTIELLYQNTGYKINQKPAKELVENPLPQNAADIAVKIDNFSKVFPRFGDVYSNYLLTPSVKLHQAAIQAGYKFQLLKNGRLGCYFKVGALTVFESSLKTNTNQSNAAADYLVNVVNVSLDEEIRTETQWSIIPMASLAIVFKF